jgi:hypothetical protein
VDGLHELTAAAASIDIDGQTYRLSPLRARDYGEIERRMLIGRPKPLDVVLPRLTGLPEPQQRLLLELAYKDERAGARVPLGEMHEWLSTVEGRVYRFWLMLRREHPEIPLERAEDLLLKLTVAEEPDRTKAEQAIESSTGMPPQNFPSGQTPTATESLAGQFPGAPSSSDSAACTRV